ncbi:glutathione S-transferase [Acinetobacter sp. ANC 4558]|uniref:glutathione S-transferase family protein n=1 Tax=Acinetobacter sp. ANC 4558 TaxID=1977876 RepID=UPI000A33B2F7|nr:glutathione S-transferase family protein [Acinetobacter sp. ANC 4558]OTG85383.1 glutathione S-transferase [Acinetobacter sp. ANC 4558]
MRILYQFPLSHFCEKARWMLDHKELEYVAQNLVPGVHRAFAKLKTGQYKLPILFDHQVWTADSTEIALYLDLKYPEHTLLRSDLKHRKQALEINTLSNELGRHVRRWVLSHVLTSNEETLDVLIGEKGYLRQFEKYSKPLVKALLSKGYHLTSDKVLDSKQQIDVMIEKLNQKLIENRGQYLVGDRLGLADIAVCSMLAPLLEIEGTPWENESNTNVDSDFQQYKAYLTDLPLGQYVLRIYQTERNARVDWRGV